MDSNSFIMTEFIDKYISAYSQRTTVTSTDEPVVPSTPTTGSIPEPIVVPTNDFGSSNSQELIDSEILLGISNSGENIYTGDQIILSSDRIMLNAKRNFLFLLASRGVAISAIGPVNIDSGDTVTINPKNQLFLGMPATPSQQTSDQKVTNAPKDQEYEPLVLGNKLRSVLDDLITTVSTMKIATPMGDAFVASSTQTDLQKISARLSEILSTYAFIDGTKHETIPGPLPAFQAEEPIPTGNDISYEILQSSLNSGSGDFAHPLRGQGQVTSVPGNRINPITNLPQNHGGLDIAVPTGTPIVAIQDGEVLRTNDSCTVGDKLCGGRLGNYVIIKHDSGIETKYGHMDLNSVQVKPGDRVMKDQVIGAVGNTGASSGPHLHIQCKAMPGSSHTDKIMSDAVSPGLINPLELFNA